MRKAVLCLGNKDWYLWLACEFYYCPQLISVIINQYTLSRRKKTTQMLQGSCTEQSKCFPCTVIPNVLTNNFSSYSHLGPKHGNPLTLWSGMSTQCHRKCKQSKSQHDLSSYSNSPGLLIWLARFSVTSMVHRRWEDIGELTPEIRTQFG